MRLVGEGMMLVLLGDVLRLGMVRDQVHIGRRVVVHCLRIVVDLERIGLMNMRILVTEKTETNNSDFVTFTK